MRTKILGFLTLFLTISALYAGLIYAPPDHDQGDAYRILYFHAPCGLMAYLSAGVLFFGAVMYLFRPSLKWDRLAYAGAELGVLFGSLNLASGMIWGSTIWGSAWEWDPRLTLQLLLWLIFIAYFMLRAYLPDRDKQARLSAVFGLLGVIDVPINYMSIRWWRGQHPSPVVAGGEGSGMEPEMWVAFALGSFAVLSLYCYLLDRRIGLAETEDEVEHLAAVVHAQ